MKLSAITDEISMDLAYALDVMREYGCEGAELRGLWGKNICDLSDDELREAKRILDEKGFPVCCIASPLLKCELQEGARGEVGRMHDAKERSLREQRELLQHTMEIADLYNTNTIRVFSFWKRGDLTPEVEQRVAEGLAEMAEAAARGGKVIALENEHDCYIGTGVEMGRILCDVNLPALGAVWDPGNAFFADEDPYPIGYDAVKEHVVHIHIKDAEQLRGGRKRFVVVGEGQINYKGHLAALIKDNYQGFISLETHYTPFAGTKEQGSRLCLAGLRRLVDQALQSASEV